MMFLKQLFFLFVCLLQVRSNLFCNGDFETFNLPLKSIDSSGRTYSWLYVNDPCWSSNGGNLDNKQFFLPDGSSTQVADFLYLKPQKICQQTAVQPGIIHELSFDFILDRKISSATLTVTVNSIKVLVFTHSDPTTIAHKTMQISSTINTMQVCFESSYQFSSSATFVTKLADGPVIDNVVVISTGVSNNSTNSNNTNSTVITNPTSENQTSSIKDPNASQIVVNIEIRQNTKLLGGLICTSNLTLSQYGLVASDAQGIILIIEGERQKTVDVYENSKGNLVFNVLGNRNYNVDNFESFEVYLPERLAAFNIKLILNGREIVLILLTKQEAEMLDSSNAIADILSKGIQVFYIALLASFSSYFILNLINFWNIMLFYIFLEVKVLPSFAYDLLEHMAEVLYSRNNLINWLTNIIAGESKQIDFSFLTSLEKVAAYTPNNYTWFFSMGMSSNFLSNNFQSLCLLVFLFVKFYIVRMVISKLSACTSSIKQASFYYFFHLFSAETMCLSPFVVVAAVEVMLKMGQIKICGKLNEFLHIILFFLILCCPLVGFIINQIQIQKFTSPKNKQNSKLPVKKIATLNIFENYQKISYYYFCFLVPILVILQCSIAFFIVITPLLLWRICHLIWNRTCLSRLEFSSRLLIMLFQVVYHLSFLLLFIFQMMPKKLGRLIENDTIKYVGITTICCILIGGMLDILFIFIGIVEFLFDKIKGLYRRCKQSNRKVEQSEKITRNQRRIKKNKNKVVRGVVTEREIQDNTIKESSINETYFNNQAILIPAVKIKKKVKKETKQVKPNLRIPRLFVQFHD